MGNRILINAILSAFAGGVKLIGGLLLVKFAVSKFGSDKLVLLGQFNNVFLIASGLAGAGLYAGYVSMSSAKTNGFDKELCHKSIIHASKTLVIGLLVFVLLWYIYLADYEVMTSSLLLLSILLCIFFPVGEILQAIVNTALSSKALYFIKISSTVVSLLLGFLVIEYKENGGFLINTLFGVSVTIMGVCALYQKKSVIIVNNKINYHENMDFGPFTKMFVISMIFVPAAKILSRDFIIEAEGLVNASIWQSYLTVSDSYTVIFTMFLSVFYLKEVNKLKDKPIIHIFVNYGSKLFFVFLSAFSLVYYIWPSLTLFFMGINIAGENDYRLFILLGDQFRFFSLLLTYNFIVRKKLKLGVLLEFIQAALYFVLIYIFHEVAGFEGVFISYLVCYVLYFLAVLLGIFYLDKRLDEC